MGEKLEKIKALMMGEGYTCVFTDGKDIIKSKDRGVRPLAELYESGRDMSGFCAADRVVGRAAAFLYVLMGVRVLYAQVLSRPALSVLRDHGVFVEYGSLVEAIRDRAGDGFCPMEQATLDIYDPHEAYDAIKRQAQRLKAGQK